MHPRLLMMAALGAAFTVSAAPSGAKVTPPAHHAFGMGVPQAKLPAAPGAPQPSVRFDRHGHRIDGRFDGRFGGGYDGGSFAYGYNLSSSYDDRDWQPESGNDWWNSRPDRAYPRWVQEQRHSGSCDPSRMWWSGSGWHC